MLLAKEEAWRARATLLARASKGLIDSRSPVVATTRVRDATTNKSAADQSTHEDMQVIPRTRG